MSLDFCKIIGLRTTLWKSLIILYLKGLAISGNSLRILNHGPLRIINPSHKLAALHMKVALR